MDQNHQMSADILEHLATREPAKTEAQAALQKKRMAQADLIREIDKRGVVSPNVASHIDNTRNAWTLHEAKKETV